MQFLLVKRESKAKHIYASRLQFRGVVKAVEKYWEVGPSLVCMTCCSISHDRIKNCRNRPLQCIIFTGTHKVKEHCCGVTGCNKRKGEVCVNIALKYANYKRNYTVHIKAQSKHQSKEE